MVSPKVEEYRPLLQGIDMCRELDPESRRARAKSVLDQVAEEIKKKEAQQKLPVGSNDPG